MAKKSRPKIENPLERARACWTSGDVVFMPHALLRQEERQITDPEVGQIILGGFHEKAKDEYKETLKDWNYAFRGRTIDGRDLRIAVAFEFSDHEEILLIVTAIEIKATG
jgi:hypothetical protein